MQDDGVGELAESFTRVFGREPAGVWAAPGRVNLIGEHTDYNAGFALPVALPQRVRLTAARREDGVVTARSRQGGAQPTWLRPADWAETPAAGRSLGWAGYVLGVAWVLRSAGYPVGGADLLVDSDVPAGSGLGSSAALECAAALALDELWALGVARPELARLAQRAEHEVVGVPCGLLDQTAALRCTAGHALFLDCADLSAVQVPLPLEGAGLALLVVDTRAAHAHASGEYAARRRACEQAAAALGLPALRQLEPDDLTAALDRLDEGWHPYVRHVVTENARVRATADRLVAGWVAEVGPTLTQSHRSLRDDYRVSCPELDAAVDAALAAGALGARMTGGGFGGCVIALTRASDTDAVAASVTAAFRQQHFTPPRVFTATAASGAARVR